MTTTLDHDQIRPLSITNAEIAVAAGIAYSKLDLTGAIVAGDIVSVGWSQITGEPTTLAGYGIIDAQPLDATLTALAALADAAGVLTNNGVGVLSWAAAGGGGTVTGAGTVGKIPKWSGAAALTDSIMTETTGKIAIAGKIELDGPILNAWNGAVAGNGNVGLGVTALGALVAGSSANTALGYTALAAVTVTRYNTAIGYTALTLATGYSNTAIGAFALQAQTTADENTAVGMSAMFNNTTGKWNVAVGNEACWSGTTVDRNTGVGYRALRSATGDKNVGVGYNACRFVSTGSENVCVGDSTTGVTTGINNTIVGASAATSLTSGNYNTILGAYAGAVTTGSHNVIIGATTAAGLLTGNYNTIIGDAITGLAAGLSNTVILADGQGHQRLFIDSGGNAVFTAPTVQINNQASGLALLQVWSKTGTDPYLHFLNQGTNEWAIGLDASASGNFVIAASSALGTTDRVTITQAGAVGIGAAPTGGKLHVLGDSFFNGNAAFGGTVVSPTVILTAANNLNDPTADSGATSFARTVVLSANNAFVITGCASQVATGTSAFNHTGLLRGTFSQVSSQLTGTVTSAWGSDSLIYNVGAGTITTAVAANASLQNLNAAGVITNAYGVRAYLGFNVGTMTNTYGFYCGNLTGGTQTNLPYSFYAADTAARNYFGGPVILGGVLTLKGYTVATLPAGAVGQRAYCTDLLAPTYLAAAVGGGAVVGPVFYNGAAWIAC